MDQASLATHEAIRRPLISSLSHDPDMCELIQMFVTDLSGRIDAIAAAAAEADLERLQTYAHQLKGAAGGYGFNPIGQAAAGLEYTLKTHAQAMPTDTTTWLERTGILLALCQRAATK